MAAACAVLILVWITGPSVACARHAHGRVAAGSVSRWREPCLHAIGGADPLRFPSIAFGQIALNIASTASASGFGTGHTLFLISSLGGGRVPVMRQAPPAVRQCSPD